MSYLSIYRKFRPITFSEVIGQDDIVTALKKQVISGKVSHAYLFSGTRGVGKTSVAKIFAKAINCLNPIDGSPCGKCNSCLALVDGGTDIIEIDAASNNGISEIRDLREKIQFMPSVGKFKVYIIDEVHMLSDSAFNALLKTLEEPPSHAVFILATTESFRLPATILSRCMRFDFRLVSLQILSEHIKKILSSISAKYDEQSVTQIAMSAEGGVRDALSITEMCLAVCDNNLQIQKVSKVLGITAKDKISRVCKFLIEKDVQNLFLIIEEILQVDTVLQLSKNLVSYLRDVCLVKISDEPTKLLAYSNADLEDMLKIANKADLQNLFRIIEILSGIEYDLKYSLSPRILFEANLFKCINLQADQSLSGILARLDELEEKLASGQFSTQMNKKSESEKPTNKTVEKASKTLSKQKAKPDSTQTLDSSQNNTQSLAQQTLDTKTPNTNGQEAMTVELDRDRVWGQIIVKLREEDKILLYTICVEQELEIRGNVFTILVRNEKLKALLEKQSNRAELERLVSSYGDYTLEIEVKNDESTKEIETFKQLLGDKLIT